MLKIFKPASIILALGLAISPAVAAPSAEQAVPESAQQQRTISGKVVDANGSPVVGAGIRIQGTNTAKVPSWSSPVSDSRAFPSRLRRE